MWHARIITTKTTTNMKTTNDDCVGIRGNNKRFGRGETHESKQRRLYIYQRAIALQLAVLGHDSVRKFGFLEKFFLYIFSTF